MKDREVILEMLGRVARRLWLNRALQEIGFGLSVALFSVVAFQLVDPGFAGGLSAVPGTALVLALATCALLACWRAARRATLAQAAGAADRRERLRDELKTAYWLVKCGDVSAFGELQVRRAARTAQRLDPRQVVPAKAPPGLWIAGALALLLAATSSLLPRPSLSSDSLPDAAQAAPSLRSLLEGAPEDERLQRLDQALAALESSGSTREQLQKATAQARDAVDEAHLRAVAARDSLSRLAGVMRGRSELDEAASALEDGRTREAIDMLKALAGDHTSAQRGDEARETSVADRASDLEQAAEESSRELRRQGARLNEDALRRVIRSIEAAEDALETQRRASEVGRRMEDFLVAASQRSALTASRFGSRASAPNPTSAPESGNADLRGGTMYRQGAIARGDGDESQEASRTGAASGHSEALELEGAKTERLEAKLMLETLRAESTAEDDAEQGQSTWYYQPTRQGEARTAFTQPPARERFAGAEAMNAEQIPLQSRQSVRDYFINLHEGASQ
jgi:hypothetical protein